LTKKPYCIKVVNAEAMSGFLFILILCNPSDPQVKRQIMMESEILRALDHPHIVKCIEEFEDGDTYTIVMEL
jgi:serine/threonine protein kinase